MILRQEFQEALADVENGKPFVPFVGGEAARIERCAIAAKRCFGLGDTASVDPYEVALGADIPIVAERELFDCLAEDCIAELFGPRGHQWSAATLNGPQGPVIILNPIHSPTRLKVTLAEELSHLVIGHPPSRLDMETGLRTYDSNVEAEAFGVGGALVMPYSRLFDLAKRGVPEDAMAFEFGVSPQLARYRINRAGLRRMYASRKSA